MPFQSEFAARLGIRYPIVQAPMAGGGDTPGLVAAVSGAGGLGSIGAAYLTPEKILEAAREVRASTDRPFAVNLFAPTHAPELPANADAAVRRVAPHYRELGLTTPDTVRAEGFSFDDQLAAALETGASVLSFTFGMLPTDAVAEVKRRGLFLIGTATTVAEARQLVDAGVGAVVAQGAEAGGHRGTFSGDFDRAMIGTASLVPQVADAVSVPVIASGGLMDGRGLVAALALGASAVQLGTAFLACDEAGIPDAYRDAILAAGEDQTRITRAFSGRPARGIVNRFMDDVDSAPDAILPFPYQNALTRPLRTAAKAENRPEFLSLWAGQGLGLARKQSAKALVETIITQAEATLARL
jgi:nitronate monooxygenase